MVSGSCGCDSWWGMKLPQSPHFETVPCFKHGCLVALQLTAWSIVVMISCILLLLQCRVATAREGHSNRACWLCTKTIATLWISWPLHLSNSPNPIKADLLQLHTALPLKRLIKFWDALVSCDRRKQAAWVGSYWFRNHSNTMYPTHRISLNDGVCFSIPSMGISC